MFVKFSDLDQSVNLSLILLLSYNLSLRGLIFALIDDGPDVVLEMDKEFIEARIREELIFGSFLVKIAELLD